MRWITALTGGELSCKRGWTEEVVWAAVLESHPDYEHSNNVVIENMGWKTLTASFNTSFLFCTLLSRIQKYCLWSDRNPHLRRNPKREGINEDLRAQCLL